MIRNERLFGGLTLLRMQAKIDFASSRERQRDNTIFLMLVYESFNEAYIAGDAVK